MKKISESQYKLLRLKARANSWMFDKVLVACSELKKGEFLLVDKEDWTRKSAPNGALNYLAEKLDKAFSVKQLIDESGWAVECLG